MDDWNIPLLLEFLSVFREYALWLKV